jgi:4-hydroxy-tetrahydrodipicolinate synthase
MTRLLDESAKGVYIIAATPFRDDGALDLESTDRMTDYYLQVGCAGITILGVMGEAPKLAPEESVAFAARVIGRVGGRIPVIVGVSAPGMTVMKALTDKVMELGAAGVMVAPMAGLKTDEAIENYYAATIRTLGAEVPIVLQDYPALTNVNMSIACVNRLLGAHPSIKVLKHEDVPGHRKISKVRAAEASGARRRRVSILVGNTALYLPQELARGADGANTGYCFPDMLCDLVRLCSAGQRDAAQDLFDLYLPVVRHEQQPGIGLALRKEILRRRGVIASAHVRAPGQTLDADDHRELDALLKRLERRLAERGAALRAAE